MRDKVHVVVENVRIKFEFDLTSKITILRGNSGTGKTTLMHLIEIYERFGEESGISISCTRKCKTLNGSNWEYVIRETHNTILFIDSDTKAITKKEFAAALIASDNDYVIITREHLPYLPYSREEIYSIHNACTYSDTQQTYNTLYRLYK